MGRHARLMKRGHLRLLLFHLSNGRLCKVGMFGIHRILRYPGLAIVPGSDPIIYNITGVHKTAVPVLSLTVTANSKTLGSGGDPFIVVARCGAGARNFLIQSMRHVIGVG